VGKPPHSAIRFVIETMHRATGKVERFRRCAAREESGRRKK
jgi:hypothetical protein